MKFKNNINKYVVTHVTPTKKGVSDDDNDYIVKCIGEFGLWQAIICFMAAATRCVATWNFFAIVFITPPLEFVCKVFKNEIPEEVKNSTCYESCLRYEYHNNVFDSTLTSEFDLICDKVWIQGFTQTVLMFGVGLGAYFFGWGSDRFGRRMTLIFSVTLATIFSTAAPFAPDVWTFNGLRFFAGLGAGGVYTTTIIIIMEIAGPKFREIAGGLSVLFDGLGQVILVGFAYYTSTWRTFYLVVGIFCFFILVMLIFLPETPRWLMVHGKEEKVIDLMTRVAKFNKLNTDNIKDIVMKSKKEIEEARNGADQLRPTILDLFKIKELAFSAIISFLIWFTAGITFFGINQYITVLGSNIYVVAATSGCVQIGGTCIGTMLNNFIRRRILSCIFFLGTGIFTCILVFVPDGQWGASALGIAGILCATSVYQVLCIQVNELFPTVFRNMGCGISSAGSKVGAMVAPFIVIIQPHWISSLIFTAVSIISVGLSLMLPETKGIQLQDTI